MELIKKILVLITSVILIASVIYLFSISSMNKKERNAQQDVFEIETPPANEEKLEETSVIVEPNDKIREDQPTSLKRDSIKWSFSKENTESKSKVAESFNYNQINKVFSSAAQITLPTVVSIQNTQKIENLPEDHQFMFPPGVGSGIIISDDGYILTNYHVVSDARKLQITLYDKREFLAEYIGSDPTTDIALLKISAQELPSAIMGNSDSLQIGEWVLAIGNPLTFNSTITAGIISAFGRDIRIIDEEYRIENFIQTDAVINPGNSGGALVNLDGEVIGINTAIATRNGLYQGYGFAIPINLAKRVVDDIVRYGYVKRGLLGISIAGVDASAARGSGLLRPKGVLIQDVRKGFPAERAGLLQGDIILAVDDEEVNSPNDLQIKIAKNSPGTNVNLRIWRDSSEIQINVTLAEAPRSNSDSEPLADGGNLKFENLGLLVRERNDSEDKSDNMGVFVEGVSYGSPAQQAGIIPGDIISTINDKEIKTVNDFEDIIKNAASRDLLKFKLIRNQRGGNSISRIVFVEAP